MSQRRSRANPTGSFGVSKGRFEERPHGRFCTKTLRIGRSAKQLFQPECRNWSPKGEAPNSERFFDTAT
jgi:hypothetical protein